MMESPSKMTRLFGISCTSPPFFRLARPPHLRRPLPCNSSRWPALPARSCLVRPCPGALRKGEDVDEAAIQLECAPANLAGIVAQLLTEADRWKTVTWGAYHHAQKL